jgi:hypothetical protein
MDYVLLVKPKKMLTVKLSGCTDCADLHDLLCQIDSKLLYYGTNHLNNTKLLLDLEFNKDVVDCLINYKRILSNKIFNPSYCCSVNLTNIISRVKILLNK